MSNFHALRVNQVKKETEDTVSISIDVPEHLKKIFAYKQGQYLTFKKKLNGEEIRRSYSLCSSPVTENEWRVAVKKVEGGLFSEWANDQLKEGDVLEVMEPEGNFFTELKEGQNKKYIAFAAGSGITPVISIIKTALAVENDSVFYLFYGNRTLVSIIFKDELDALSEKYGDRFSVTHILSRDDEGGDLSGRIDEESCDKINATNPDFYNADEYFICGPEQMIFSLKDKLISRGVGENKIHFELFTTPVKEEGGEGDEVPELDADVTIIIDGEEFNYPLSSTGEAILDASMDAGADVPFSCKGAVCCTCRAKLMEGKVHMDMNFALTDQEVADGYILTCQSHPITPKVVVDYDAD